MSGRFNITSTNLGTATWLNRIHVVTAPVKYAGFGFLVLSFRAASVSARTFSSPIPGKRSNVSLRFMLVVRRCYWRLMRRFVARRLSTTRLITLRFSPSPSTTCANRFCSLTDPLSPLRCFAGGIRGILAVLCRTSRGAGLSFLAPLSPRCHTIRFDPPPPH